MRLLLLAPLLAGCALLTPARTPPALMEDVVSAGTPGSGPLVGSAQVSGARVGGPVSVVFSLQNTGGNAVEIEYSAQVNYGACGYPPYVVLRDVNGRVVRASGASVQLSCPQVRLSRTLPSGETLVLRRALPSPGLGTFTVTAWFDGLVDGRPNRTVAPDALITVHP